MKLPLLDLLDCRSSAKSMGLERTPALRQPELSSKRLSEQGFSVCAIEGTNRLFLQYDKRSQPPHDSNASLWSELDVSPEIEFFVS
jgi:hypothetical protein